jgi:hypothetical protein
VGEGTIAMAARQGGGAKGSPATALTRGKRRHPGRPAGLAGPGKMGRGDRPGGRNPWAARDSNKSSFFRIVFII